MGESCYSNSQSDQKARGNHGDPWRLVPHAAQGRLRFVFWRVTWRAWFTLADTYHTFAIKMCLCGAGRMAQSVPACNHEKLGLIPGTIEKKLAMVIHTWKPNPAEVRTRDTWSWKANQSSPLVSARPMRHFVSKNKTKRCGQLGNDKQGSPLSAFLSPSENKNCFYLVGVFEWCFCYISQPV